MIVDMEVRWECPLDTYRIYGPVGTPAGMEDDPHILDMWPTQCDRDLEDHIEDHEHDHHGIPRTQDS